MPKPKPSKPSTIRIAYDPERHCGHPMQRDGKPYGKCKALKGQGTAHPGIGKCADHATSLVTGKEEKFTYYETVRTTRLQGLLRRARDMNEEPSNIQGELEYLRALVLGMSEDNPELDDPETVMQLSDLLSKVIKAAETHQKIQQNEMIHIKAVELIHMQMAEVVMRSIMSVDPQLLGDDWKDKLIEQIKVKWGAISVETNPRELKRLSAGSES